MNQTVVVSGCSSCPLLGRGHTIYCNHPSLKTEEDAHIIHRDYIHEVPEKCPLRKEPLVKTIQLKS